MQDLRLGSSVVSVTLLQQGPDGRTAPVVLHTNDKKKKRKTKGMLVVVERVLEQMIDAQKEMITSYRRRFRDSSRKKRDGWLTEMPANVYRAVRDGARTITLERIV